MKFLERIIDIVFPKGCVNCGKYGEWLCLKCISKLSNTLPECFYCRRISNNYSTHEKCFHNENFKQVQIIWKYEKIPKNIMSAYKYDGILELGSILGNLCSKKLKITEKTIITIIPLSNERESQRGFNQVDLVAQSLLKNISQDILYLPDLLVRKFDNSHQAHLPKELRQYNIEDIFKINSKYNIKALLDYQILIIDDVVTTGSTLNIAGKVLKNVGFKDIYGFALFRGKPRF